MTDPVAQAVRQRRLELGLTLEVLARGSGVSRAMLSDVERGARSPTLRILSQIAMGLGCRVTDLLDEPEGARPHLVRADQHPVVVDERSGVERRSLASPWLASGLEVVRYTLPAGAAMQRGASVVAYRDGRGRCSGDYPPNPRGSSEHVTVEAGRIAYRHGEVEHVLRRGDTISYRLLGEHHFENPGRSACRLALVLDTRPLRGA